MMQRALAAILIFGAVLSSGPASAQSQQDYAWCGQDAERYTPQQVVQGCNALLAQGSFDNNNLAIIYSNRGNAYKRQGDLPSALSDQNQALRYNSQDGIAYYNRGNVYLAMGDAARAMSDYNLALQYNPEHAPAWYQRAQLYDNQGNYPQAISDYSQAILLVPNDPDSFVGRGNAYLSSNDYSHALADYNQAIRLRPDYATAFYNRGLLYDRQNMVPQATADYDHAIQLDPQYAHAWGNRGHLKLDAGDYSGAIADITHALAIRESGVDFNNRGLAYVGLNDYLRAIPDFDNAARLEPNNQDYQNSRCWYRGVANTDLVTARAACDRAVALASDAGDRANNLDSRALVALRQGRWQDAYNDYDAAVRAREGAHWVFGRGYAAYRLGRTEQARADFARGQQLASNVAARFAAYGFTLPPELLGASPAQTPAQAPAPVQAPTPASGCDIAGVRVFFVRGEATLDPSGRQLLDVLIPRIRSCSGAMIVLRGSIDGAEAQSGAGDLGQRRAAAVRDYLAQRGIAASSLALVDVAFTAPMVQTGAGVSEPQNRNVEFAVMMASAASSPPPPPVVVPQPPPQQSPPPTRTQTTPARFEPGGPGRHVFTYECPDNSELRVTFDNDHQTAIVARIRRPPATLRAAPLSGGDFHYSNQNYDLSGAIGEVLLRVGEGQPMRCPRHG